MAGTLGALILATVLFVGSHFVFSSLPIRARLIAVLGENGFRAAYSILALALLVWLIVAFNAAPAVRVWVPPIGLRHLSLVIMPVACIFVVAGLTTKNPTPVGADTAALVERGPIGIFKLTRHPVMWGVGLWGIAHLLANGDSAGMILFAGLTVLALAGAAHSDARRHAALTEQWDTYRARTSFVPFAAVLVRRTSFRLSEIGWTRLIGGLALFAVLLIVHPWLFGVSPLPGVG